MRIHTNVKRGRTWPARTTTSGLNVFPASSATHRAAVRHILRGPRVQAKLTVGPPNDKYEREADRIADEVMRMPAPTIQHQTKNEGERQSLMTQPAGGRKPTTTLAPTAQTHSIKSTGRPLPQSARGFFEPRFGYDLGHVRVHTGPDAATMATALKAKAFALGQHIVFNRQVLTPDSSIGKRILAHELTHVIQQAGPTESRNTSSLRDDSLSIRQSTFTPRIARARASDCASDCTTEDGKGATTGKFSITVYADKEGPFLLLPLTHKVGHSWLRLEDDQGRYWTYGFWPKTVYDPSNTRADVEGCVHHPDTSHKPTASQRFELTAAQFAAAFTTAAKMCSDRPKYNLFGLQCTEFVRRVLAAAGKGGFGGFGLIWESPNALDSWIRTHSLLLGTSVTATTTAEGKEGRGSFGLDVAYRNQFYSLLGQKLRLYGVGRMELSGPVKSLTAGAGLELNPQKVWLPALFVEGGGIVGDLSPVPEESRIGAGLTGTTGLRYNIDELGYVGVEHNIVKDLVNKDPTLHRLMITAGIRLF